MAPVVIGVVLAFCFLPAIGAPFVPAAAVPPAYRAGLRYRERRAAALVPQDGVQFGLGRDVQSALLEAYTATG